MIHHLLMFLALPWLSLAIGGRGTWSPGRGATPTTSALILIVRDTRRDLLMRGVWLIRGGVNWRDVRTDFDRDLFCFFVFLCERWLLLYLWSSLSFLSLLDLSSRRFLSSFSTFFSFSFFVSSATYMYEGREEGLDWSTCIFSLDCIQCITMYSKTSDSGHSDIGTQYNKPLNKRHSSGPNNIPNTFWTLTTSLQRSILFYCVLTFKSFRKSLNILARSTSSVIWSKADSPSNFDLTYNK